MAKDYARGNYSPLKTPNRQRSKSSNTKSSKKNNRSKPRRSLLLLSGFLLAGLLVALFVVGLMYLNQHKIYPSTTQHQANKLHATKPLLPKRKFKQTEKPHFDFYTILPNKTADYPLEAPLIEQAKESDTQFILQVASVKDSKDADRLRAQLILLGYHVFITKSQAGKIAWHRVNIGPFKSTKEAENKQEELHKSHINSLLLKKAIT